MARCTCVRLDKGGPRQPILQVGFDAVPMLYFVVWGYHTACDGLGMWWNRSRCHCLERDECPSGSRGNRGRCEKGGITYTNSVLGLGYRAVAYANDHRRLSVRRCHQDSTSRALTLSAHIGSPMTALGFPRSSWPAERILDGAYRAYGLGTACIVLSHCWSRQYRLSTFRGLRYMHEMSTHLAGTKVRIDR